MGSTPTPDKQTAKQDRDEQGKFAPGVSGNPNGRPPKDKCISDLMRAELLKTVTIPKLDKNGKKTKYTVTVTKMQLFVESQIGLAMAGDAAAAKNVWERVEGKVPMPVDVDGGIEYRIILPGQGDDT